MKKSALLAAAAVLFFSPALHAKSFLGYACLENCEGHEAGYRWADENKLTRVEDCRGKSESFIEGCVAYIEDQADNAKYYSSEDDADYTE
ncbi:MAG: hypothetical protein LBR53_09330 [Deltaproteobacteria bacterium]|jgi:hypothetical protein|nr:hypothetical protein [Deltaproteobacteria bacterium]